MPALEFFKDKERGVLDPKVFERAREVAEGLARGKLKSSQFRNYFEKAAQKKGATGETLLQQRRPEVEFRGRSRRLGKSPVYFSNYRYEARKRDEAIAMTDTCFKPFTRTTFSERPAVGFQQ